MNQPLLNRITLTKAIGEIFFIFIGVTMAIWFNNWNEHRKLKEIEIHSLEELKSALNQDLNDIQQNIVGYEERINIFTEILKHLKQKKPFSKELSLYLGEIIGLSVFISNTGAYETLKSRGLETISNDSIRLQIAHIYDYQYEVVKTLEPFSFEHQNNYMKPIAMKHLDFSKDLAPISFEAILQDANFKQGIHWSLFVDRRSLAIYKGVEQEVKALISSISKEITHLK